MMNNTHLNDLGHYLSSIFNSWWLLLTVLMGLWLILGVSSFLINGEREAEAQLAFIGGWFWLVFGLISFGAAKIFDYFC